MVISLLCCLLFSLTFCVAHQQLYILNNHIRTNFTKLNLLPNSGIQECIEACNIDENCCAFGVKSRMSSDQVDCYISNGHGLQELDTAVEILVKFDKEELLINETRARNTKTENCPSPFVEFGDIPGCYCLAVNEEVTWQEAEDACQALDQRAHLISFDSLEERAIVSQSSTEATFWTGGKDHDGDDQLTWIGTGEEIPDDADYWYYETPGDGDCVFMYAESYNLENELRWSTSVHLRNPLKFRFKFEDTICC